MSCDPNTNRLFETNNFSIISKYSAVKSGYFKDEILEDLVENSLGVKSWRRTPLVNRGYAARLMAMDWTVRRALNFNSIDCAIVLGAGYDTLPFRYEAKQICWIELDLPPVVEAKSRYICRRYNLSDPSPYLLRSGSYSFGPVNYHLIACDIRDAEQLRSKLLELLSHIGRSFRNVAIINEVCLCYVSYAEIRLVLATLVGIFKKTTLRIRYLGYEQVRFDKAGEFDKIMTKHFQSLGHPLKYFPTPDEVQELFRKELSFDHATVSSMYQIYHNALLTARLEVKAFQSEPFDEYEEMDLYLSHYAIITAILFQKDPILSQFRQKRAVDESRELSDCLKGMELKPDIRQVVVSKSALARYGHASCVLQDEADASTMLVTGGFGTSSSNQTDRNLQHKRLSDCLLVSKTSSNLFQASNLDLSEFPVQSICLDRMHGQVCHISSDLVFFNGGRRSPIRCDESNVPFLARLSNSESGFKLTFEHQFSHEGCSDVTVWRHRIAKITSDKVIQVGGIGFDAAWQPLLLWDLSSSNLGCHKPSTGPEKLDCLYRHSFGMDIRDPSVVLIFGGLQTDPSFRDRPVDAAKSMILFDLRQEAPIVLPFKTSGGSEDGFYGSDVHFINEWQFLRIGGLSTSSGLANNSIGLVDLRTGKHLGIPPIEELAREPLDSADDLPLILTNATTCHLQSTKEIVTLGGGGNYFTFGTHFNASHLIYSYMGAVSPVIL